MTKNNALLEFLQGLLENDNNKNKKNSLFKSKDEERKERLEKQMDNYNLEEWQKKLVREGKFEPWSFDEGDDLEEEDYYYDEYK